MKSIVSIVEVVRAVEAKQRIETPQRTGVTYFSENDVRLFDARADTKVCPLCRKYETAHQWRGNNLRAEFPYLVILDENTIGGPEPDGGGLVHPNCRCVLKRIIGSVGKL